MRAQMKSGDEYDALTRTGRRVHKFKAGKRSTIKRRFRRRERHTANIPPAADQWVRTAACFYIDDR